jgi:hypothetical protein
MAGWLTAALAISGWLIVYVSSRKRLRRVSDELRSEFRRQIDLLSEHVSELQQASSAKALEEISPEVRGEIGKIITGLLGRKARILSVKQLQKPEAGLSSWAQQGRVVVQASHNLAQRGHDK